MSNSGKGFFTVSIALLVCLGCVEDQEKEWEQYYVIPKNPPKYVVKWSPGILYEDVPVICVDSYKTEGTLICLSRKGVEDCRPSKQIKYITAYKARSSCLDLPKDMGDHS